MESENKMTAEDLRNQYKAETGLRFLDLKYTRWLESKLLQSPKPPTPSKSAGEVLEQAWKSEYEHVKFNESDFKRRYFDIVVKAMHEYATQSQPTAIDWGKVLENFAIECTELDKKGRTVLKGSPMDTFNWFRTHLPSTIKRVESEEEIRELLIEAYQCLNNSTVLIHLGADRATNDPTVLPHIRRVNRIIDLLKSRLTESNK